MSDDWDPIELGENPDEIGSLFGFIKKTAKGTVRAIASNLPGVRAATALTRAEMERARKFVETERAKGASAQALSTARIRAAEESKNGRGSPSLLARWYDQGART